MPPKLLLADHSVTIQRVIELTFADEDIEVVTVSDGQQAIARVEVDRPDIVLADAAMPERDGYEVAAYIKGMPHLAQIPVLLLHGAFEPVDEARARAAHVDGVLSKPFEPQTVINRVRELLMGRRTQPRGWGEYNSTPRGNSAAAVIDDDDDVAMSSPPPASAQPPRAAGTSDSLEDYFDRLDEVFGTIAPAPPAPLRQAGAFPSSSLWSPVPEPPVRHAANDPWASPLAQPVVVQPTPRPPTPELQTSFAARVPERPPSADAAPAPSPAPAAPAPAPTARRDVFPFSSRVAGSATTLYHAAPAPLADAFEALFAAEQAQDQAPGTLRSIAPIRVPDPSDDGLVTQVTQRVLAQITNEVVRATLAQQVGLLTERLVRQELDRLRSERR